MLLKYQNLSGAKGRLNEIKFYFHGIPAGFNYRLAANPYRAGLLHSGRSTRPPPHKGPKAQSLRLMHTLTLPFAHARPSATGTADRGNVSVLFPHIFPTGRQTRDPSLRGRFPAASAAVPRKGKRRRGCSGGKEAGLPASSSRSDEQRPGSRWSGPTHAPGLLASPTRERSRPEIFWFSSPPPSFFKRPSRPSRVPEARPPPCRPPLPVCPPTPAASRKHPAARSAAAAPPGGMERPPAARGAGPAPTSRRSRGGRYLLRAAALTETLSTSLPERALPGPAPHPDSGPKRAAPVGRCAHGTRPPIGSRLRRSEGRGRRGLAA